MRMIDADKLHYIKVPIANGYDEVKRDVVVFAKEIDKLARKTECFGKWIPVTERMPEDRKLCVVMLSSGEVTVAQYNSHRLPHSGDSIGWGYAPPYGYIDFGVESVTHWIPIPKRSKEEE